MSDQSFSEQLMNQAQDLRQYQGLKEANEIERDAIRRYYDSLRRKGYSDESARQLVKQKGFDIRLLK